ncbi:TIGR02594 family protein [Methylosinus sporium]|uniref:TIGR02594 family protein n=1 Tax=Methylosinus sporium TaxID=428 RepID=A0A549T906_METSR|nr:MULTISPECIES: TIGR02594 family protein [Methylosinus]MBU3887724.1 TIGR02594 family protein [Methylosinus sp. KRF6]TRL38361.1 TIGR02594 family protein [Methylosinus sporium]
MTNETSGALAPQCAIALPKWIEVARSYIGTHEGVRAKDNPKVVELYALAGHPEVEHDSVPWCAAFVGACLRKAGLPSSGTLWALDYAKYGDKLSSPIVGAIATKKRDGGGHVFFVVDFDGTHVWGLGGNQSDAVSITVYPRSVIHSYSWPHGVAFPKGTHDGAFRVGAVKAGSEA